MPSVLDSYWKLFTNNTVNSLNLNTQESHFVEVKDLANYSKDDWTKEDIEKRNEKIYKTLKDFFKKNLWFV